MFLLILHNRVVCEGVLMCTGMTVSMFSSSVSGMSYSFRRVYLKLLVINFSLKNSWCSKLLIPACKNSLRLVYEKDENSYFWRFLLPHCFKTSSHMDEKFLAWYFKFIKIRDSKTEISKIHLISVKKILLSICFMYFFLSVYPSNSSIREHLFHLPSILFTFFFVNSLWRIVYWMS